MHLHKNTALNPQSDCDLLCTNIIQVNTECRKQNHSHSFRQIPYHIKSSLPCETAAGHQFTAVILKLGTHSCGAYPGRNAAAEEMGVK